VREASPQNHLDGKLDSDQQVVNQALSLCMRNKAGIALGYGRSQNLNKILKQNLNKILTRFCFDRQAGMIIVSGFRLRGWGAPRLGWQASQSGYQRCLFTNCSVVNVLIRARPGLPPAMVIGERNYRLTGLHPASHHAVEGLGFRFSGLGFRV